MKNQTISIILLDFYELRMEIYVMVIDYDMSVIPLNQETDKYSFELDRYGLLNSTITPIDIVSESVIVFYYGNRPCSLFMHRFFVSTV